MAGQFAPSQYRGRHQTFAHLRTLAATFAIYCVIGVNLNQERPKPPPKRPDRITLLERRVAALEHELTKLLKDKSDA
jgi:hypothetical protein